MQHQPRNKHAWREALRAVKLDDTVIENAIPMNDVMIHSTSKEIVYTPLEGRVSVFTPLMLNELVLTKVEAMCGDSVHFEHKLTCAKFEERLKSFKQKVKKEIETEKKTPC